jgi:hypothetical protein
MSHTPGPWKYGRKVYKDDSDLEKTVKELPFDYKPNNFGCGASIFGPNDEDVAGNDEYQVFFNPEDIELIVAAPNMKDEIDRLKEEKIELLEALNMFVDLANNIEEYGAMKSESDWRKVKCVRDVALNAIRKARCDR